MVGRLVELPKGTVEECKMGYKYKCLLDVGWSPVNQKHDDLHVKTANLLCDLSGNRFNPRGLGIAIGTVVQCSVVDIARERHTSAQVLHCLYVVPCQMIKTGKEITD